VNVLPDDIFKRHTTINWSVLPNGVHLDYIPVKEPIDYFFLSYPMQSVAGMENATQANINEAFAQVHGRSNAKPFFDFDRSRFYVFMGIQIERAVHPVSGGIDECWRKGRTEGTYREGGNYGERFKMTLHEYKNIKQYLQLSEFTPEQLRQDPWIPISPFVEAFNDRRNTIIKPGSELIVDESMSWWTGKDGEIYHGGMPHKSYVKRKPKPNGCEIKSCADVETGVMLRLEIQKGKTANAAAEYMNEYPHHAALGLRLTKPWHNTQRVNNGDAGFGSFHAAKAHREKGLHFRGIVKQASKFFPAKYLKKWKSEEAPGRGKHKVLTTAVNINGRNEEIHAIAWNDKRLKLIVSTNASLVTPGPKIIKKRTRMVFDDAGHATGNVNADIQIDAPHVVTDIFNALNKIDVADQYRQGTLAFEEALKTHEWWFRIWVTIFAICIVDAYFMYRADYLRTNHGSNVKMMDVIEFAERLSFQLINYEENASTYNLRPHSSQSPSAISGSSQVATTTTSDHSLDSLRNAPFYTAKKWVQNDPKRSVVLTCVVCKEKTARMYCTKCSLNLRSNHPNHVALCAPRGRFKSTDCFLKHCMDTK
jgi:hypothetical protein